MLPIQLPVLVAQLLPFRDVVPVIITQRNQRRQFQAPQRLIQLCLAPSPPLVALVATIATVATL